MNLNNYLFLKNTLNLQKKIVKSKSNKKKKKKIIYYCFIVLFNYSLFEKKNTSFGLPII